MHISIEQLQTSVSALHSVHPFFGTAFLAFKAIRLPVGRTRVLVFSNVVEEVLQQYYRASPRYQGFYSPFQTSSPDKRWLSPRYGSTSLQRIVSDTFSDAFIHEKRESEWGWANEYVESLERHLHGQRIPAFDLAVWLWRDSDLAKSATRMTLINKFFATFNITESERRELFEVSALDSGNAWLVATKPSEEELFSVIGHPPGHRPIGAALRSLKLRSVGPGSELSYCPSERLNLITGDNSLGKTFLLDIIWWALTANWFNYPAMPQNGKRSLSPQITFATGVGKRTRHVTVGFSWDSQQWELPKDRGALPGLVIYARHDGSFAVWDYGRAMVAGRANQDLGTSGTVKMSAQQVWNGLRDETTQGDVPVCSGLIADWVAWQGSDRFRPQYEALVGCLEELSPDPKEPLMPGEPVRRLPLGAREVPTLKLPYGEVPLLIASAGVQRAVAIAYMLVWSWYEHLTYATAGKREPQRHIIVLVDEVEAHLHPRWQRVIVPAIVNVVSRLSSEVSAQIHISTHSPMVMASLETHFDEKRDSLFHLKLIDAGEKSDVLLEQLPFIRRGPFDRWAVDPVIGLQQARSVEGEGAIAEAVRIQAGAKVDSGEVKRVHHDLLHALADDDPFWPRWLFFAREHGAEQ
jgi:hypothetical protein